MVSMLLEWLMNLFSGRPSTLAEQGFRERRKAVRLRCAHEVKLRRRGKSFKATIVDIGAVGLKLRSGEKLKVGERVELAPVARPGVEVMPVECRVRWVKSHSKGYRNYAGLIFTSDKETMSRSWVKDFMRGLGFTPKLVQSQREFIRAECFLEARFKPPEASGEIVGKVYNLGLGGLLLETPYTLPIREPINLELVPINKLPALRLQAVPLHAKKEGQMKLVGMQFEDLSAAQNELLGRYIQAMLKPHWA